MRFSSEAVTIHLMRVPTAKSVRSCLGSVRRCDTCKTGHEAVCGGGM